MQIRISDSPIYSMHEHCDVLIALDKNSIDIHRREVPKRGAIIYDPHSVNADTPDRRYIPIPLNTLSKEIGSPIFTNVIAGG